MAIIKWGSIVVDGRGKIGGQVYSRNRSGAYVRNKVTPVNPQTSFQQTARQQLGNLSAQWKGLTQAQRDAWNSAVGNFLDTNVFGDSVTPTGKNLFVGLNRNLTNIGSAVITSPPLPQEFPVFEISAVTFAGGAFTVTTTDISTETDFVVMVFATNQVSPGVGFVQSEYRFIGTQTAAATATPLDIAFDWVARFGTPAPGLKAFVKLVLVSNVSGQKGVPVSDSAIAS